MSKRCSGVAVLMGTDSPLTAVRAAPSLNDHQTSGGLEALPPAGSRGRAPGLLDHEHGVIRAEDDSDEDYDLSCAACQTLRMSSLSCSTLS